MPPSTTARTRVRTPAVPTASADDLLTYNEVALILKVSRRTVRHWVSTGDLKACAVTHKTVRIRRSTLDAFITASEQE